MIVFELPTPFLIDTTVKNVLNDSKINKMLV